MSPRELFQDGGHLGKIQSAPLSSYCRLAWVQSCTLSIRTLTPLGCDYLFTCVSPEPDCKRLGMVSLAGSTGEQAEWVLEALGAGPGTS